MTLVGVVAGPGPAPLGAGPVRDASWVDYAPPVDAPVVDPFRLPPQPWLPGNRGLEYATEPGTSVRAAGRGTVTFAGLVAGSLHVTVSHPDGVRTSYSHLAEVAVALGQAVARGTVVGRAGSTLHIGARRGDAYIDPASLWAVGPPWVRLVPLDQPGSGAGFSGGRGWAGGGGPTEPDEAVRRLLAVSRGWLPRLLRRSGHRGRARSPPRSSVHQRSPLASGPGDVQPLERRRRGSTRRDDEAALGGRCPLRAPDPALEPEDAAVHPR